MGNREVYTLIIGKMYKRDDGWMFKSLDSNNVLSGRPFCRDYTINLDWWDMYISGNTTEANLLETLIFNYYEGLIK